MAASASPYSIFKAEDWMVPQVPNGVRKFGKVSSAKIYPKTISIKKKVKSNSKMKDTKQLMQLAFA